MKHIIGYCWFNGARSTIGIVAYINETNIIKAVIGTGLGDDENEDIQHIADYGGKFPLEQALILISNIGNIMDLPMYNKAINELKPEKCQS